VRALLWVALLVGVDRAFAVFDYPGKTIFAEVTDWKADHASAYLKSHRGAPAVFVLGSSHALFGISPEALLGTEEGPPDAYNFGIGGVAFEYQKTVFDLLIERGSPELVILAMDYFSFQAPPPGVGSEHIVRMLDMDPIEPLALDVRVGLTVEGSVPEDRLGCAVALSDGVAVLGASGMDSAVADGVGAAYVFEGRGKRWREECVLTPANGRAGDHFGVSVAADGETVLVGAWRDDEAGADAGAAYVFVRQDDGWTQQAKLLPSAAGSADAFGWSVALDGDTALIGARQHVTDGRRIGAAFVFRRTEGTWREEAVLSASDAEPGHQFGTAVSLRDGRALVGAPKHKHSGQRAGAAYVFRRDPEGWVEEARLVARDAEPGSAFGASVCLDGGRALIGANERGCAYVFAPAEGVWASEGRLDAVLGEALDGPVAMSGEIAVVGGTRRDGRRTCYAFSRDPEEGWQRHGAFTQEEGTPFKLPGAVGLRGRELIFGDLSQGADHGATFLTLRPFQAQETHVERLSLAERIPLASFGYRYREDVRRYVRDLFRARYSPPFLRHDGERDREMFTEFESIELDEYGHAQGLGRANPDYLRRRGTAFMPQRIGVEALESMVALAARQGVDIALVHVPEYVACHVETERYRKFRNFMESFAKKNGLRYHDFNRADRFPIDSTELFFDSDHLNLAGAELFSQMLGERLGLRQPD
jgi:hypothetical protein